MRVSAQQFARFSAPAQADWTARTTHRLHAAYHSHYAALNVSVSDLEPVFQAVHGWAAAHHIVAEREVASLCCLVPTLGHHFWQDPRFETAVNASVRNTEMLRPAAVRHLTDHASAWVAGLWQGDTITDYAARLNDQLWQNIEPAPQSLYTVLPNHWTLCEASFNARLIEWLILHLPPVHAPAQRFALVACALVHGTRWLHDPQYAHIAHTIMASPAPEPLMAGLQAIYGALA